MFSDVHICFQMITDVLGFPLFSRYSLDVLRMFIGFFLDVFKMLRWVLWAWWNLMIISNESMDFDDPQLFDDPSFSMIPSYSMINGKYGL